MSVISVRIACDIPCCFERLTVEGEFSEILTVTTGTVSRALARDNWEEIRPRPGSGRETPYHACPKHIDVPEAELLATIERAEATHTVMDQGARPPVPIN